MFVDFADRAFLGTQAAGEVTEMVGGQGTSAFRVSRMGLPLSTVSA